MLAGIMERTRDRRRELRERQRNEWLGGPGPTT